MCTKTAAGMVERMVMLARKTSGTITLVELYASGSVCYDIDFDLKSVHYNYKITNPQIDWFTDFESKPQSFTTI